jgi:hypothetical protein
MKELDQLQEEVAGILGISLSDVQSMCLSDLKHAAMWGPGACQAHLPADSREDRLDSIRLERLQADVAKLVDWPEDDIRVSYQSEYVHNGLWGPLPCPVPVP